MKKIENKKSVQGMAIHNLLVILMTIIAITFIMTIFIALSIKKDRESNIPKESDYRVEGVVKSVRSFGDAFLNTEVKLEDKRVFSFYNPKNMVLREGKYTIFYFSSDEGAKKLRTLKILDSPPEDVRVESFK